MSLKLAVVIRQGHVKVRKVSCRDFSLFLFLATYFQTINR